MSKPYTHLGLSTQLRGVKFRSRLEARWALYFDGMGIGWQYEPQRFNLDSGTYIPDFRLTWPSGHSLWVEVKPIEDVVTPRDRVRYQDFTRNRVLLMLVGLPAPKAYKHAAADGQPGGVVLLRNGPIFVLTTDGSPFDMTEAKQAALLAVSAKFLSRRGAAVK